MFSRQIRLLRHVPQADPATATCWAPAGSVRATCPARPNCWHALLSSGPSIMITCRLAGSKIEHLDRSTSGVRILHAMDFRNDWSAKENPAERAHLNVLEAHIPVFLKIFCVCCSREQNAALDRH